MSEFKGTNLGLLCPDCHGDNWGDKESNSTYRCLSCAEVKKSVPNYYSEKYLKNFREATRLTRILTYLAGPYTHPDHNVELDRFNQLNRAASHLMRQNKMVFSPISHSHPIALAGTLPTDWQYWKRFAGAYLRCSKEMIVVKLPGYKESVGVNAEIKLAVSMGIPITYMDPV